ncbi:MAG TPA: hypothetical protein VFI37_04405, partial [Gaiellaceae bacterium]|nr:hypothetical protein [Gaiellaceae bacterium]
WSMCAMIEKLRMRLWSTGSAAIVATAGSPPASGLVARRRDPPRRSDGPTLGLCAPPGMQASF